MAMDDFNIGFLAGLDGTKSKAKLNQDIDAIKKSLKELELKAKLDQNQVKALENQLNNLKVNLNNVSFDQGSLNRLVSQINTSLSGIKLQMPNLNTGNIVNQAKQTGQQIGQQIQNSVNSAIQKGSFEKIFRASGSGMNNVSKDAEAYFKTLSNTVSVQERLGTNNNLTSFAVSLKNAKGVAEQLNYQLKKLTDDNGNIIDRYFEYTGGSINDNGVIKQMNAISAKADSLQTKLDKLKANYSDTNASRPIKDASNISALSQQYDKVTKSIENVRNTDNSTFSSMISNAQKEITTLETMVSQFRNAENVATQMKSVDISSGIAQAQERFGKLKANASGFEQMKQTLAELDTAITNVGDKSSLDTFINKLKVAESQLGRVKAETKLLQEANKIQLSTDVTKLTTDYQKFGVVSQQVENNLKELKLAQEAVVNAKGTDRLATEIEKYDTAIAKAKSSWKELSTTQVNLNQRTSQMTSMQEWMRKNSAATKLSGDRVRELIAECNTCNKVRFDQIKNEFKQIQVEAGKAGKLGNGLFKGLVDQGKNFAQWIGVSGAIMQTVQTARQMYQAVYDIDTAMTELAKVSDTTNSRLQQSLEKSIDVAKKYGSTVNDVVSATADWSRLGYNMDDAEKLAEVATIYKNVGDGIDISTANESLISTLQGFGKTAEDAMHIIDSFNEVANNFAIDSNGIGQALQRSASSMSAAGNTMEETIGLITAANGVVQDPESVGTAFKTISMRIRSAKTELEEMGEDTDGMVESTAKLQEEIMALSGVDIMKDKNTFKSTYQIMDELSQKWKDLTDIQRASITELIAGKRQGNIVSALMTNFDVARQATETAITSEGSALKEQETYLSSLEAKTQQFVASFQSLSNTILDSDLIKFFVDLGTTGVKAIDGLVNALGGLGTIGLLGGAGLGIKNVGMFKTWLVDLQKVQLSINSMSDISPLKDWDLWNDGSLKDNVLKQYTESINGLSLKQAELALSTKGLEKTQQEQILVEAGLLASSEKISSSLVQEALSVSGLSVETQKAILSEAGLMDANTGELLTTKACTEEKLRSILATKGIVGANADAIVSSVGLGTANTTTSISFSTLTKSVKANTAALLEWMLTNPVGWITLICTSVYGLTKLVDLLTTSIDEQTEKLNTAKESYESISSELENNETELKNIIAKIDELNAKDKLTFVEQSELENLKANNEELERTIQLNKEKKAQEEDNYADELYKTYNQRITQDNMNGSFKEQIQYYLKNEDLLNRTDIDKHKHNLQWLIAKYESIYDPSKVGTKWYDEQIKSLKSYITEATSEYNELYGNINGLSEQTLKEHPEFANTKKELQQILEYSDRLRNVADYRQEAYNSILSSDIFQKNSDFKDKLTLYLTKGGSLDTEVLKQKFGEDIISSLQEACENGGLTLESFINEMYSQATDNQSQKLEIQMPSIDGTLAGNEFADALKQNMDQMIDDSNKLAVLADNTTTEITQSLSDKFNELWNSESFADAKKDLAELADESKITASGIENLAKENVELADLLDESGMSAQFAAECFDSMCRGGKGFDAITNDALLLDQVLNGMTSSLEQATQAKSEYDNAMSKEDYNANFKNYQEAYSSAMEMFKNGEYGKHFRDTMEYLLGTDSYTMSIDELRTAVQNLGNVFGENATNGYEFLDNLYANKEILDDMDSSLTKLSDGSYDFDLKPDEFEAIAEALGMTTEEVTACTNALGMFGDYSSYDLDELELALNSISIAAHDGEKSITSLQGVENILSDLGYSGYDVYQIMQQIHGMGTIELIDFEEGNLDDTLSKLKELENVKIDGSNINLDSLITGMQALGNSNGDIVNFIDRLNGQFNLTDAQGKLIDFETAKNQALSATENGVSDDLSKVGEEAETTTGKVSNVNTELDTLNKKTLSQVQLQFVNVSTAANTAKGNVQKIIDKINTLNNSKISVKSSAATDKSDGKGYHGTVGNAFANGTNEYDDIPNLPITGYSGLSKDEKNALRSEYGQQELTVYPNGKTELTNQPTMNDLPKGTVIFNERQTKKILNGTNLTSGNAFASGTAKKNKLPKSSDKKKPSKKKDKSKTEIDWIARKLERLQKIIDMTKAKFENLFDLKSKSSNLDKQIEQTTKLQKANEKATKKYEEKAKKYAKSSKLSESLQNAVQEGRLDGHSLKDLIKKYGEKTAEKINKYKGYWDNAQEAKQQVEELTTAIRELKEEKYQLYVDDAESNIDKLNAQKDIAVGYANQNSKLEAQKTYLKQSYDYQIKIADLTKDEVKKVQLQAEYQKQLRDLEKEKFENIEKYYSNQIKLLDLSQQKIEDRISLLETKGMTINAKYYEGEIAYQKAIMQQYNTEYSKLKGQLAAMEKAGMKGTDDWYDKVEALSEVESEITNCNISIAEMNNKITEVGMSIQNKILSNIKSVSEEMEWTTSLMSEMDMFKENSGAFTNEGLATLGSYASGYNNSKYASKLSDSLVNEMNKALKTNKLEFTFNGQSFKYNSIEQLKDAITEANETWRDQITETYEYSNKIIDMMVDKLQSELSAMQELIEAKKDALTAEQDLYNYQKSIRESVDNAASLEKQIAALQGNNSEENMMKIQKLQKELGDSRQDIADQEYDRYISDQQDILDKLYSEYESLINAETKDRDALLQKGIQAVELSSQTISQTIGEYADKYNYTDVLGNIKTGLDTMTGNDSPLNSIKTSVLNAIAPTGTIPTAISGLDATLTNIAGIAQKILESSNPNAKSNTGDTSSPSTKEKILSGGLKQIDSKALLNPVVHAFGVYTNSKSGATAFIKNKVTKATKKKSEYSAVNQKVYDLTKGKVLSTDNMKELAKIVGVKYNNAGKSGNLYKKLKSLKVSGFKRGGIAQLIKNSGEDGITLARNGEGFIAPEHIKPIQELVNLTPQLDDMLKPLISMPKISDIKPVNRDSNVSIDIGNIELHDVQDPKQFASQLVNVVQKDRNVQNMFKDLTDIPVNRNYNRLGINKYK